MERCDQLEEGAGRRINEHDDGYDITDHYGVDTRLGSIGDFVALNRTAKDSGLRVIIGRGHQPHL